MFGVTNCAIVIGQNDEIKQRVYLTVAGLLCSVRVLRVVRLRGRLPHLHQHVAHLLALPLGADVRAQAPLQELQRALVLGHLQLL